MNFIKSLFFILMFNNVFNVHAIMRELDCPNFVYKKIAEISKEKRDDYLSQKRYKNEFHFLPQPVKQKILSYLPKKDFLRFRLVCQDFNQLCLDDSNFSLHLTINDSNIKDFISIYRSMLDNNIDGLSKLNWRIKLSINSLKAINLDKFSELLDLSESSLEELAIDDLKAVDVFLSSLEKNNFQNLKKLDMNCTLCEELPDSIGKLENLKSLKIVNNKFYMLPSSIGNLTKLKVLDLTNYYICLGYSVNKKAISILPPEIGELKNLKQLNLFGNCIKELPLELANLKKLTFLNLSQNYIQGDLPEVLGELSALESLELRGNQIKNISPNIINRLEKLRNLDLNLNPIENEPELPEHIRLVSSDSSRLPSLGFLFN